MFTVSVLSAKPYTSLHAPATDNESPHSYGVTHSSRLKAECKISRYMTDLSSSADEPRHAIGQTDEKGQGGFKITDTCRVLVNRHAAATFHTRKSFAAAENAALGEFVNRNQRPSVRWAFPW